MKDLTKYISESQTSSVHPVVEASSESKIYFPTPGAFAIYMCELLGQVSDGYWENARPMSHWKWVGDTEAEISDTNGIPYKEGYTGPQHRIKYSTEWLRRYVKKALKGNAGDWDWTIRVFNYGKMANITPVNLILDLKKDGYDAWRSIAQELPEEEVNNEELEKKYTSGSDYRKKYWEKAGKKYFSDELLKKYYKSSYDWSDFEDDLETAEKAMNTHLTE